MLEMNRIHVILLSILRVKKIMKYLTKNLIFLRKSIIINNLLQTLMDLIQSLILILEASKTHSMIAKLANKLTISMKKEITHNQELRKVKKVHKVKQFPLRNQIISIINMN